MTALNACADDCTCNGSVLSAIDCVNGGGTPFSCFGPVLMSGTSAGGQIGSCLLQAGTDCGCQVNTPGGGTADAEASEPSDGGCMMSGGSGSSGNGACTSTIEETCGSTVYQAVCSCPEARCVCFGDDASTVIQLDSCPYCPNTGLGGSGVTSPEDVLSMCGFPQ